MAVARREQIDRLRAAPLDVLVIGGGINGAGVLRDLALRAHGSGTLLRVGLIEQAHFASGTSGKNSQLIHGGLRYLKYLQFHLVRESLRERSTLLKIAPQFVKPLAFLLPMYGASSRLVYGAGLWLYDRLAGPNLIARHQMISARRLLEMEPGLRREHLSAGALFYDCAIQSARFVVENVLDAIRNGASAANYVRAEIWGRGAGGRWRVECKDTITGGRFVIEARKLVDARGAWTRDASVRLLRGSHIVIPRVTAGRHAVSHFEPDGRIVFLIPWGSQDQLTLVGTTDENHSGGPDSVRISRQELEYLLAVVRKLFPSSVHVAPIAAFSSLRALVHDDARRATRASREHKIWSSPDGVLHILGGKYTTYRLMSEEAVDLVCRELAPGLTSFHPTQNAVFPGGERVVGEALEQHLSDHLFTSTYLGYERRWDRASLLPLAESLAQKLGWSDARTSEEVTDALQKSDWENP